MKSNIRVVHNSTAAVIAIALAAAAPMSLADEEIEFDEAELFFELNDTDGDLGIHSLIDGEPWKRLEIEDPRERRMLKIYVQGRLRHQGLTELFFESAEPTFDELAPKDFFKRFPQGEYEIEGKTLDGMELESDVELTHLLPAPAQVSVGPTNGEEAEDDECVEVTGTPVIISWDPVTTSHPNLGRTNEPITVVNYEVVVEIDDDEIPFQSSIILPPDVTEFQVPQEILDVAAAEAEGKVKYEVLVREESYNQTAVESCFEID